MLTFRCVVNCHGVDALADLCVLILNLWQDRNVNAVR